MNMNGMNTFLLEFGQRIKELRISLEMSQAELATKVGYKDKTAIAKVEAGKVDLPQSKIVKIAETLKTTAGYLMGNEDADGNEIPSTPSQLSDIDKEILEVFSQLSDTDKKQALDYLAFLKKRDV